MPITGDKSDRCFLTKILNYDKVCSESNSMSILDDLIPILHDLCMKEITGTFNFVNPGLISHNEM